MEFLRSFSLGKAKQEWWADFHFFSDWVGFMFWSEFIRKRTQLVAAVKV